MFEHRFNTDSSDDLIVNVNPAVDAHVIDVGGVVTAQQPSAVMIHNFKQKRTHTQCWCERAHIKLDATDSYYTVDFKVFQCASIVAKQVNIHQSEVHVRTCKQLVLSLTG